SRTWFLMDCFEVWREGLLNTIGTERGQLCPYSAYSGVNCGEFGCNLGNSRSSGDAFAPLGTLASPCVSYKSSCTLGDGPISSDWSGCFQVLCHAGPKQCDPVGRDWRTVLCNPSEGLIVDLVRSLSDPNWHQPFSFLGFSDSLSESKCPSC